MFGLSNPLTEPLVRVLEVLNGAAASLPLPSVISSYAVAIVLVAIVIKLLTYPLTAAQMRSTRGMQELQPKLKELQKKYKDDREKLAQAQMELYREHGINPLGGCLPLVVQLFVLFGLYSAIRQLSDSGVLDGQRFFWINSLGKCEASPLCTDVGPNGLMLPGTDIGIPVLLIVLVVSQFAYQKFATPPATDAQSQAMSQTMRFMPLFFAFIFASLPSGLLLYYTVFNLVTVGQQALMAQDKDSSGPTFSFDLGRLTGGSGGEAGSGAHDESESEPTDGGGQTPDREEKQNERAPKRRRRRKKNR